MANITAVYGNLTTDAAKPLAPIDPIKIVQNAMYAGIGPPIIILNAMQFITICYFKKLRQRTEMKIYAASTFTDFVTGWGYLAAGTWRLFANLQRWPYFYPSECMRAPHTTLFLSGFEGVPMFLTVISIDRLIAVSNMQIYPYLGSKYLAAVLGLPTLWIACNLTAAWILSTYYMDNTVKSATNECHIQFVAGDPFKVYDVFLCVSFASASVILYLVVMVIFWRQPVAESKKIQEKQLARQRKVTKTLGAMSVVTFLMLVIPLVTNAVCSIVLAGTTVFSYIHATCRIVSGTYSIGNGVTYISRQKDLRKRMAQLFFRCKWQQAVVEPSKATEKSGTEMSQTGETKQSTVL